MLEEGPAEGVAGPAAAGAPGAAAEAAAGVVTAGVVTQTTGMAQPAPAHSDP